jgi:uncharacterized membrane protein
MNDSLKVFLISSVKTALISFTIAGIAYLLGGNIIVWFAIGMVAQYALFYLLNTYLEYKAARDARVIQLKEAEIMTQNTVSVECAACKKESEVLVRFGQANYYTCGHCDTKNTIFLFAETAVTTEPKYDSTPAINTSSTNGL